ncbi:hypothetical protein OG799_09565 [Micromonospora sp. NBC_00898]|uniref:DUF6817 domain-containing protein n=1 Tax=Micromonospora sp. NBC_00898 TaxID=2975981 RepID=UPI00386F390D|nr:hypothetical protein OG799_09565 [Micromonospora sp. NBC_00898]
MGAASDVRRWLRQRGTETIQHLGGTLYAHLCRVHDRLAELECGVDAQLAGLAHAVYGTDGFDVTLLDRTDRATLRNLIGDDAEALVYLYGACDRRRTWRKLAMTGEVVDRFTGQTWNLGPRQMQPFVDLSIVNELDVIEQDPSTVDKYGEYFRSLFAAWAPIASPQVTSEAQRLLGEGNQNTSARAQD